MIVLIVNAVDTAIIYSCFNTSGHLGSCISVVCNL